MMKAQIVSFHCVLRDRVGKIISSTFNNEVLTCVDGPGKLLQALAKGLQNLKKGEKRIISLSAEQAYGFYDPELVIRVSRRGISQGQSLQIGNQIITQANDGELKVFRVIQASVTAVTLDGNHPLAGHDLVFDIEAVDAREATAKEIKETSLRSPVLYFN